MFYCVNQQRGATLSWSQLAQSPPERHTEDPASLVRTLLDQLLSQDVQGELAPGGFALGGVSVSRGQLCTLVRLLLRL